MKNTANIITQILTYSDTVGTTDNPQLRNFDWNRRLSAISIDNPDHGEIRIPAGGQKTIFDGLRTNDLDATSMIEVSNISGSTYKLERTAGASGNWRTARTITALTDVDITINNDSVATFEFVGATIVDVAVGDILRVVGDSTHHPGPYDFNSVNSGLWSIIGVTVDKIQAIRASGEPFSGIAETVTGTTASQIEVYSPDGVQKDDKFELKTPFSSASHKVFTVKDVTPSSIFFVSTSPIPEESVSYPDPIANGHSLIIYSNSKRVFYLESDQEISIQFNDDAGDNVRVCPISAGNPDLIGYIHKFGPCYKVVIRNKSVNLANILYFVAE